MCAKQLEFLYENPIRVIGGFFESTTNSQRRNFHHKEHEAGEKNMITLPLPCISFMLFMSSLFAHSGNGPHRGPLPQGFAGQCSGRHQVEENPHKEIIRIRIDKTARAHQFI